MAALVLPPKAQMQTEDLFTAVYCCVDEHYHLLFGNQSALRQSHNNQPAFTDAEVITIALVGELMGEDSQRAWHGKVKKNWRKLFPLLCDRTRYGRRLRRLRVPMAQIQQQLCFLLGVNTTRYRIVDSLPLSLAHLRRVNSSTRPFEYLATVGYCASKKEHYYGFKVQLLCDLRGIPTFLVLTPAHAHDLAGFEALVQELAEAGLTNLALLVVADKGYVGKDFLDSMKALYYEVADEVGEAHTDEARLKQVVINLLSNALKFTERGEVHVACRASGPFPGLLPQATPLPYTGEGSKVKASPSPAQREKGPGDEGLSPNEGSLEDKALEIAVSDTGVGMPPEALGYIFEEFRQVEGAHQTQKGTGLGLSITKKLTELLGGTIGVESEVGKGSTFTVRIPVVYRGN